MRSEIEFPTEWAMPSATEENNGRSEERLGTLAIDAALENEDTPSERVIGFAPQSTVRRRGPVPDTYA